MPCGARTFLDCISSRGYPTSLGNFRVEGFNAVPVEKVPEGQPPAPRHGIAAVSFADGPDLIFRKLEVIMEDGRTRSFDLNWEGAGTDIFVLHQGPDGLLYGSSILPEHLFSCALDGSTKYFYRFYATNSLTWNWATNTSVFSTIGTLVGVDNSDGATNLTATSATLRGTLTVGSPSPDVWISASCRLPPSRRPRPR